MEKVGRITDRTRVDLHEKKWTHSKGKELTWKDCSPGIRTYALLCSQGIKRRPHLCLQFPAQPRWEIQDI